MSISTERGDAGQTSLPGGSRTSKSGLCVEAYGTIDQLISSMGLARALCSVARRNSQSKERRSYLQF
jgi:cob(I)alamin adenosyltransferase